MGKFLKGKRRLLFIGTFIAITFLVVPVMAAKITPAEKLRKAEELSSKASEIAIKTKETTNIELATKALELVNKASFLVLEVVAEAQRKNDYVLAQAAINIANKIMKAITQIITAVTYIAQISTDPANIADANKIMKRAEEAKALNNKTIQAARTLVVKPGPPEEYKPPREVPEIPPPDTETTEQEMYQEEASPSQ